MMKKIFTGLYALTLAFVCSCSRDDDGIITDQGSEITFSSDLADKKWSDSDDATRATDATWTLGDQIGIYMLPAGGTLANAVGKNFRYKYENSGKFKPDPDALWYPGNGANVNFVAYYPYSPTAATVTFNFADQSDQQKKEGVDFCFHRGTTAYNNVHANAATPSMQYFYHKFSKIKMTVSSTGTPDLSDLVVKLTGMPASATVDLAALTSNPGNLSALGVGTAPTTITAWTTRTATSATVEAIVAPHPGTANFTGRTITFATNNGADVKSYTIPDNVTFESGKVYGFTVTYGGGVTPPPFPTYTEDGMTNSYMVAQNGEVSFEVSRAYEYNGSAFTDKLRVANTANYTGGFDAKVLWQDPGDLIESPTSNASAISGSGNTAIVTVKAKNNKSGNAVIGIYKTGTSTLVWSYHIWVTDYMDGGTGKTVSMVNNHVFMDRNLGATAADLTTAAYGLLYQWGRKDPFPGSVSGSAGWNAAGSFSFSSSNKVSDQTATGNAVDIIESIQNPTKFYRDVSSGDWLPARDNNLWQASGGEKTIYDPCPIGWRVPVYKSNTASVANSPWMEYNDPEYINYATDRDWNSTDKGWKFTRGGVDTYYPAAGYRGYNSGFAYSGGVEGIYWSASVNSFNAAVLDFLSTYVLAYSFAYRAYGFSVRCVRE